jgi:hypothetical protein
MSTGTVEAETVTVNFATDKGVATFRASGFLGQSISVTTPTSSLITAIKPQLFRASQSTMDGIYGRVVTLGGRAQLVVSDFIYSAPWPGDGGNWSTWENRCTNFINTANSNGQTFEWDIWNEPNHYFFWGASQAQWFEAWRRCVVKIRAVAPGAVIVGPSVSGFDQSYIESFLTYAKANNVLPNVLTWHDFDGGSQIPTRVQAMRSFMTTNGINVPKISINEMIHGGEQFFPGVAVRYFSAIERTEVVSAVHACWDESGGTNCFNSGSLNGLLTFDGTQPRSVWWAYKGYADVSGRLVDVAASPTVDAVAGQDLSQLTASVVLGRWGGTENVAVRFRNIGSVSYLNNGGKIRVVAQRIAYSADSPLVAPTKTIDVDYAVSGDELTVVLPDFGSYDAYTIKLSPGSATSDTSPPAPPSGLSIQ